MGAGGGSTANFGRLDGPDRPGKSTVPAVFFRSRSVRQGKGSPNEPTSVPISVFAV